MPLPPEYRALLPRIIQGVDGFGVLADEEMLRAWVSGLMKGSRLEFSVGSLKPAEEIGRGIKINVGVLDQSEVAVIAQTTKMLVEDAEITLPRDVPFVIVEGPTSCYGRVRELGWMAGPLARRMIEAIDTAWVKDTEHLDLEALAKSPPNPVLQVWANNLIVSCHRREAVEPLPDQTHEAPTPVQ